MRRAKPEKREILPDIRYNSVTIQTMIHHMLQRGKKSTAVGIMYDCLDIVRERSGGKDPVEVFDTAMRNVAPAMEVKPRRVGGATYQVPMEVPPVRRTTLAIRWVLDSAKARTGKSFAEKLADELMDAYKNEGASIRKREETHKMAEANRAFSHYRM
ncbi:MAG TPA: 30S ribosomal protein S7 [Anaerolineales bacterium]|nr:30S ribosomal protein S7 [Anaerolineales bacterium]